MKKQKILKLGWEYLKKWVGILWVKIFRVGIFQGELMGGNFPGGSFPDTIYTYLFRFHNIIILLRHNQVCLMRLCFERYFSHHQAILMIMFLIFNACVRHFLKFIIHLI